MDNPDLPRLDKTKFAVFHSFEEAEEAERQYWWSKTPQERMVALEVNRKLIYGYHRATARLERVLRVTKRTPG
jgi:hypothetical protein